MLQSPKLRLGKHEKEIEPLSALKSNYKEKVKACEGYEKTEDDKEFIAFVLK